MTELNVDEILGDGMMIANFSGIERIVSFKQILELFDGDLSKVPSNHIDTLKSNWRSMKEIKERYPDSRLVETRYDGCKSAAKTHLPESLYLEIYEK